MPEPTWVTVSECARLTDRSTRRIYDLLTVIPHRETSRGIEVHLPSARTHFATSRPGRPTTRRKHT